MPPEAIESPKQSLPHYALPNFSVVLPDYANNEADVIRSAFNTANFRSIADLPDAVKNGAVNRSRFEKMTLNRQSPLEGTAAYPGSETVMYGQVRKLPDKTNKAKYFMEYEYTPSPYSLADELAKEERLSNAEKMAKAGHTLAFRQADTRVRLPHEDVAGNFTEYIIDPFECASDQVLRQKWLMDAQVLAAPFKPAGSVRGFNNESSSEITGRAQLPGARRSAAQNARLVRVLRIPLGRGLDASRSPPCAMRLPHHHPSLCSARAEIVAGLSKVLTNDWEECPMLVCATDDEHIVIRFDLATLEEEPGLIAYMNVLAASHEMVSRHKLKKVVEDWNVMPGDGYVYFTFRPPWVHVSKLETFYSLHPEQRVFHDRRAEAAKAAAAEAAAAEAVSAEGGGSDGGEEAALGPEFEHAARSALPGMI